MAMSAFRSTTRRNCQIGGYSSSAEGKDVPSTPRSKREPSPSGRGSHRRSASVTDFSARYLSDCSSTSDLRSSYNKGTRTGRRSLCPSDSESDMDSLSAHRHRNGSWVVQLENERLSNSSASKTGSIKPEHKGLRRTLSSQDFSQSISKARHHVPVLGKKAEGDHTEELVEEKTIRAVYAQMKSLQTDPSEGNVGMTDFFDAMRAEVRRAVSDIRMELDEKNDKLSSTSSVESVSEPHKTDVMQAIADIRKEYTAKLEESEKKVRELWSQIAVEERRCLELSRIVKEVLPAQAPALVQTSAHSSSSRRRPLRRKNSADRQFDLKSLDDEALRYFEECVSISSYDCQGDSDDSMKEKENSSGRRKSMKDVNAKGIPTGSNGKKDLQPKASSARGDGVTLPWLQWEAEAGTGGDKSLKQVERDGKGMSSKSSSTQSSHLKTCASKSLELAKPSPITTLPVSTRNGSGALSKKSDVLNSKQLTSTSLFSLDDNIESAFLDVDSLLFDKIKFRRRVENGELLLCQGMFLM